MKRIGVELDGVTVTAVLFEDKAPVTVAKFWECLPYEDRVTHGKWSGDMFHTNTDFAFELDVSKWAFGMENPVGYQAPGDIVFLPVAKEIAIAYGGARFSWVTGPMMVSAIGRIEGDLTEFAKKADRLQWEGAKRIVLRRL
ncbi:MAG TPA: DUF3830 family protein [bacterium]|nr:DUF3830 family protein [bacterium]